MFVYALDAAAPGASSTGLPLRSPVWGFTAWIPAGTENDPSVRRSLERRAIEGPAASPSLVTVALGEIDAVGLVGGEAEFAAPDRPELVENVLTECPEARSDNRYLILKAWEREGLVLTEEQWGRVPDLSQPETLRRHGCKIRNEEGRFTKN